MTDSATLLGNGALEKVSVRPPRSPVLAIMGLDLMIYRGRNGLLLLAFLVLAAGYLFWIERLESLFSVILVMGIAGGLQNVMNRGESQDRLCAELPASRAVIVNCWWLEGGLSLALSSALNTIIFGLFLEIRYWWVFVELSLVAQLSMIALGIPIFICFGKVRGTFIMFFALMIEGVIAGFCSNFLNVDEVVETIVNFSGGSSDLFILLSLLAIVVVLLWWLSHRIYERQDH